eukprot:gnl/MRDRNA2_/MRDRNA2_33152_c0_seq1.p1 gnl/MRDRNA2_/MRDRNA2_33152_c0~~gnl/MRDRNA2_/MRDRNA2_33152_c0_seq1.p1  ORF type:complete len:108 (-),score=13.70 gnl/MRDRNA2_/MRDRNA2_33152_c0_seq1:128-451(-)
MSRFWLNFIGFVHALTSCPQTDDPSRFWFGGTWQCVSFLVYPHCAACTDHDDCNHLTMQFWRVAYAETYDAFATHCRLCPQTAVTYQDLLFSGGSGGILCFRKQRDS